MGRVLSDDGVNIAGGRVLFKHTVFCNDVREFYHLIMVSESRQDLSRPPHGLHLHLNTLVLVFEGHPVLES